MPSAAEVRAQLTGPGGMFEVTTDTVLGREMEVSKEYEQGKLIVAQSGCLACHKIGENGNDGPGPELTHIAEKIPRAAIIRSLNVGPGIMPAYDGLSEEQVNQAADFLASLD